MRYFVVSLDGQKYGPADIPTLQQWIGEGRIMPSTYLEEEIGGARMQAGGVQALRFPVEPSMSPPVTTQPYQSVYTNPMGDPNRPQDLSQNPYADGTYAYHQSYPGAEAYSVVARQNLNNAWVLGAIAISVMTVGFCCMVGPLAGIALSIFGMGAGKKAKEAGHPNGQSAYVFNIVILVISVVLLGLSIFFYIPGALN